MKLTVLGATGGIGGQIVRQALAAGHDVTAVVREKSRLALEHPALRVVTADPTDAWALVPFVTGRDAVLSALGPRGRKAVGIASAGTAGALQAMDAAGVRRVVVVSAAPLAPIPDGESLFLRYVGTPLIRVVLKSLYADLAEMETLLRDSPAEWTSVRPPRLTDKPFTGSYRTVVGGAVPKGMSISRADTAHAMLAMVDDPATFRQPVGVAY
ncbi:NAD(P)-dependent oxidoreductase [Streptacidiphilus sp. N1-3]|uniref:NAD(P)-dependent oxidoreductase n=1 Tax=Streptacidiphilus alkalitolerans TaxID=3342712 RepID=A0ABV6WTS8_9ACTN